jgi:hypothetical protein
VSTIESRSKENAAALEAATPKERAFASRGLIDYGFTPTLVHIALDKPDGIKKSADGREETWVYHGIGDSIIGAGMGPQTLIHTSGPNNASPMAPGSSSQRQNYSLGRADPSGGAVDAELNHLYITFTDGKVSKMEVIRK